MKNIFIKSAFIISILLFANGCGPAETTSESSGYSFSDDMKFMDKLKLINRVKDIKKITQTTTTPIFSNKVLVTFDMPLDWNNPSIGTFPLRVEIGYYKKDAPTVYQCHGYMLNDYYNSVYLSTDDRHELAKLYTANFVNIEHRFFFQSRPEDLDYSGINYWKYLTSEQAAKDFHFIIENLSYIMTGKKIMTGASKGGYVTNVQALLYPNDCDVYVPYVAPLCATQDDDRFFKNIYETIGVSRYGEEKAKEYRDLVKNFQIEYLKNRDILAGAMYEDALNSYASFRDYVNKDNLYDAIVLDAATAVWQYNHDFASIKRIMNMPKVDDSSTEVDEHITYLQALASWLKSNSPADAFDYSNTLECYYYQSITEMGNYRFDFSYLREELEKQGLPSSLITVTKEEETNFWRKMLFTPEQMSNFTYSDAFRNKLIDLSKTTEANIAMVYGQTDTWYAVRMPENDNPNIKIFAVPDQAHSACYLNMSTEMATSFKTTLDTWLGIE